jgi:hypothetical protein
VENREVDPEGNRTPIILSAHSSPPYRLTYGGLVHCRSEHFQTFRLLLSPLLLVFPLLHNFINLFYFVSPHSSPCGGGLGYLHRSPVSRRRRRKGNPVPGGYNWATLLLGDVNTETLSCKLGVGSKADGLAV